MIWWLPDREAAGKDRQDGSGDGYKVGDRVRKFFPYHGWFDGRVESINPNNPQGKCVRVRYEDGDVEDNTLEDLAAYAVDASIPIDNIGYKFVKKFGRDPFNGVVQRVL